MLELVQLLWAGVENVLPGVSGPCRGLQLHFWGDFPMLHLQHLMLKQKASGKEKTTQRGADYPDVCFAVVCNASEGTSHWLCWRLASPSLPLPSTQVLVTPSHRTDIKSWLKCGHLTPYNVAQSAGKECKQG